MSYLNFITGDATHLHEAARIRGNDSFGTGRLGLIQFRSCHFIGDFGHFDGEETAKAAAAVSLFHFADRLTGVG